MRVSIRPMTELTQSRTQPKHDNPPAPDGAWLEPTADPSWLIRERRFSPAREPAVEARFTVSNGRLGIRGTMEEHASPSHPQTFVAGLFDLLDTEPAIPALISAPEWLGLRVSLDDGTPLQPGTAGVGSHVRILDLRRGALWREWEFKNQAGQHVRLRTVRFASAVHRSLAVHLTEITAAQPAVVTIDESTTRPAGMTTDETTAQPAVLTIADPTAPRESALTHVSSNGPVAIWETEHRKRRLAVARTTLELGVDVSSLTLDPDEHGPRSIKLEPNTPVILARIIAMAPASGKSDPTGEVLEALQHVHDVGVQGLFSEHVREWERRWDTSGIEVTGDEAAQRALRFAIYHLISAANPDDNQVSVGARGLTGEAYWGHVFWDTDIFMMPFYTLTWPEAARAMLEYRHRGLAAAREKAARFGCRGALYAWEAAENGEEATPDVVVGLNGQVIEIKTGTEEHHISADVAYAAWQYWQTSGDDAFLRDAGAEIILETARFWASRAALGEDGRYHIARVIGPDEYHEDVDDSAYTNLLAQWNLRRGLDIARFMRRQWPERWLALSQQIGSTPTELRLWRKVASGLAFNHDATGVLEQFAGYFNLAPINLADYEPRTQPLDMLLGHAAVQRSQVIKQADVLMAIILLWDQFHARQRRANFAYYEPRCGHGSSLSPPMHAYVSGRLDDLERAERYFRQAASIDLEDAMGNAAGGVHMATQGGLWQAAVCGFGGLRACRDGLRVDPHLPEMWQTLGFRARWRGRQVHFSIGHEAATVTANLEAGPPLMIYVGRHAHLLQSGQAWKISTGRRGRG
jgi:trehalose/maltose hydrolase-like predicted phosphorylase